VVQNSKNIIPLTHNAPLEEMKELYLLGNNCFIENMDNIYLGRNTFHSNQTSGLHVPGFSTGKGHRQRDSEISLQSNCDDLSTYLIYILLSTDSEDQSF
jgi:hypothetical protein